jgi:hypothetical protein
MILAQATQPNGGFASWTPEQWVIVLGAVGALVATLITSIGALIKSGNAQKSADDSKELSISANTSAVQANKTATAAKAVSEVNSQRITNVSQHAVQLDGKLTDVARAMPPVPTPEAMGKAFNAAGPDVT